MADRSAADAESEEIAAKPPLAGLKTRVDQESVDLPARTPGSWPDSRCADASKYQEPPEQSTGRLQGTYRYGISYLKRILSDFTVSQDSMHYLASDSSLQSGTEEVFQTNDQNSPSSRLQSLSKDEVKATGEGLTETKLLPSHIESSDQEDPSTWKSLAGKRRNSRSSTWTDAVVSGASVKPSGHIAAGGEEKAEVKVVDNDTGKWKEIIDSEDNDLTFDHDSDDVTCLPLAEKIGRSSSPNSEIVAYPIAGLSSTSSGRESLMNYVCCVRERVSSNCWSNVEGG